ncbi:hypothetical protein [Acetobacterium carbinolicum]|uniref:hypothetical protein n=1 Tax=Acetobacterium carbinolicum TaxID=52690 RepID=UPI0039C9D94E
MIFDIQSIASSEKFIEEFFNTPIIKLIEKYIIQYNSNFDEFWIANKEYIDSVDISDLKFKVIHVTSNMDECSEIRTNGIKNLQRVLSEKTTLYTLLSNHGIQFDIKNRILINKDRVIDIDYKKYCNRGNLSDYDKKVKNIARKVYTDYQVNGFFSIKDPISYGTNIHKRPEFIFNLVELIPELRKMENHWVENSKGYIITFLAANDQFQNISFYDFEDIYYNKKEQELNLKKWLLYNAIDCIIDCSINNTGIIAYMNTNTIIRPEQILECSEITRE